jgi:hypothetical protein
MAKPRLHLDADTSAKALEQALLRRGHDVTRTPNEWMPLDADDETQLLRSIEQGRTLFTYNIHDFVRLALQYPGHTGIVFASQEKWSLAARIAALHRMLSETEAEEWIGQVRWLSQWRSR